MKKLINALLITFFMLGAITVEAQRTDTVKTSGWMHHDFAGAQQIQLTYRKGNISQLDAVLINNGFPILKEYDLWINISMSHVGKKIMTEDGLGFTPVATSEQSNIKIRYNQYQAYWRIGYNLSNNSSYRFYPFAGVNLSAAILNIQDKPAERSVNNFSDELLNSTASKTLYQPNFGVELGAGFDFVIKLSPKVMDCITIQRNIPVGFRVGYYINTYASNWKLDGYGLGGDPNQKQSAVFATFNIGLGYAVKHQN